MNANRYNDPLLTAMEEQAYAEIRQHFSEHLNQFPASQGEVRRLEQDLSRMALAVNLTTSRTALSRIRIQTGDGASWYTSVELMHDFWACYRPTGDGTEFAAVELSPSGGAPEVVAKGRSAAEVVHDRGGIRKANRSKAVFESLKPTRRSSFPDHQAHFQTPLAP